MTQIKVKSKQHYVLSIDATEQLLNKYIRPNYKDKYTFNVRQSDQSRSIYIDIMENGEKIKIIRLSDHYIPGPVYHYISDRTKISKVINIITGTINRIYKIMEETGSDWHKGNNKETRI